MNQEQNNLNQNSFNMQENNGMQNPQPLNNVNQPFADNSVPMNNNVVTQQFVQNPQPLNNVNQPFADNSVPMNNAVTQQFVQNPQVDNNVMQNNGQTVNSVTQQFQQPMNQPMNQPFMNNNFNNQNPKQQKKNLKLLIGIGILIVVVIIIGVLIVSSTNKQDKNNDTSLNNSTNNNSSGATNNNSNDNADDDSLDYVELNTYGNIIRNVDMKVNSTYLEDKFNFAIKTTFKNNGNKDEILSPKVDFDSIGEAETLAYYQMYYVPKNVSTDNFSDEDVKFVSCYIRKVVRNGEEFIPSQSSEDTLLKAGETLEALIYCPISSTNGYAENVNPLILEVKNITDSNETITNFAIRNSIK